MPDRGTTTEARTLMRGDHGDLLIGRREQAGSTGRGWASAHHAAVAGPHPTSACTGALLDASTLQAVADIEPTLRCQRLGCRNLWRERRVPLMILPVQAAALFRLLAERLAGDQTGPDAPHLLAVFETLGGVPQDHRPLVVDVPGTA